MSALMVFLSFSFAFANELSRPSFSKIESIDQDYIYCATSVLVVRLHVVCFAVSQVEP